MSDLNLTIAILTKNAAATIENALNSSRFAKEILILDDHSTDNTIKICRKFTDKIFFSDQSNFAAKRNEILKKLTTDWIFYLDSDEEITPKLQQEIMDIVNQNVPMAFRVKRINYFLGTKMYPDVVDRLFHRSVIKGWSGEVHESPILTTPPQLLKHSLIHRTHTDITSMLEKTNHWSEFEAELRIKAHHPPVAWWRLIRIAFTEFWHQFIKLRVGSFGRNGVFEGYFQIIDKLIVYTKLWEKQHRS